MDRTKIYSLGSGGALGESILMLAGKGETICTPGTIINTCYLYPGAIRSECYFYPGAIRSVNAICTLVQLSVMHTETCSIQGDLCNFFSLI